ncbi:MULTISPECIES: non-ribosomal peptide synthase/polyketide synthase, partial [unclassified Gordonia (in: high G+C Gram-positive bacteria)]|uniref:non-ribosomal peptide synthase/polyketide synthase n=1 Tax=unclassified Gordonia (in: high G+C Gram-positive bacteria) TaxID=2657482 RepID=UPI001F057C81
MSTAQFGLWLSQQLNPDVPINMAQYVELRGELDVDLLERAMIGVGKDMGSGYLRLLDVDGTPYQVVDPELEQAVVRLDFTDRADPRAAAHEWMQAEYQAPLDMLSDHLFLCAVLKIDENLHYWYSRVHHIALDGVGAITLMNRTAERYTAALEGTPLPEPGDDGLLALYRAEETYRNSTRFESDRAYWTDIAADMPEPATFAPRHAPAQAKSVVASTPLHAETVSALESTGSSFAPATIAAFAAYLSRMTGSEDVVLSLPVSARTTAAMRRTGGMVSNVVPLRVSVDSRTTVQALIDSVGVQLIGALRHQRYRTEDINRDLGLAGPDRSQFGPLVNIMIGLGNLRLGAITSQLNVLSSGPVDDLMLNLYETGTGGLHIDFIGNPGRYTDQELRRHHDRFEGFFTRFVSADGDTPVSRVEVLDAAEHAWLTGRAPESRSAERTFADILVGTADSYGDDIAITFGGVDWTYRELDERSNRLARLLIARGIGPESFVALAVARSIESVLSIWATAKTGAVYLPIDPNYPDERIAYIMSDAAVTQGITVGAHTESLPQSVDWIVVDSDEVDQACRDLSAARIGDAERSGPIRVDNPAYMIYTSGSTGLPKGVVVTHRGLGNLVAEQQDRMRIEPRSRTLHFASPSFDASVFEMMMAFGSGSTLVVAPAELLGGEELSDFMREQSVTHACVTPAALAVADPAHLDSLRVLTVAGDACPPELVARWAPGRTMLNLYGPTEATIWSTVSAPLQVGEPVTIGAPVSGVRVLVLDSRLRPVPMGVTGELYLAGPALARGYFHRESLTASRFVADPYGPAGERLYRTGDVVRWTAAGALEYVGRSDFQVKIRGFRIELGEIDDVLASHESVDFATAQVRSGAAGQDRIVGYVLPKPGEAVDAADLLVHAGRSLPAYMVPSAIVVLDEIPLTVNGKLDRDALPDPQVVPVSSTHREPQSPLELRIAAVVEETLGVENVSADADFFEMGGDSIVSMQLVSRAKAAGVVFTARDVFERRTVAGLAEVARTADAQQPDDKRLTELPGGGVGEMPLTPVMHEILSLGNYDAFAQSLVLVLPQNAEQGAVLSTVQAVLDRHDMLRVQLVDTDPRGAAPDDETHTPVLLTRPVGSVSAEDVVREVPAVAVPGTDAFAAQVAEETRIAAESLDPRAGAVIRLVRFTGGRRADDGDRVLVLIHHLAVDAVSWRVLVPDFAMAWAQVAAGAEPVLGAMGTSMRRWTHGLNESASAAERLGEFETWRAIAAQPDVAVGSRYLDHDVDVAATERTVEVTLDARTTDAVLNTLPSQFRSSVNTPLLTALAVALAAWRRGRGLPEHACLIALEGHGRDEAAIGGADLSQTVGWFTTVHPVRLDVAGLDLADALGGGESAVEALKWVKEQLLVVPGSGIGYGLLRALNPTTAEAMRTWPQPQIAFNYLGRLSSGDIPAELREVGWLPDAESLGTGAHRSPDMPLTAALTIDAIATVDDGRTHLTATFGYASEILDDVAVRELADLWKQALQALAQHATRQRRGGFTPSDLPLVTVGQSQIEAWEARYPTLADVWSLSPLQSGLLFHTQLADQFLDVYTAQVVADVEGVVDTDRMRRAGQALVDRHDSLRTAFVYDADGVPAQPVVVDAPLPFTEVDLTGQGLDDDDIAARAQALIEADRIARFDLTTPPLVRMMLIRTGPHRYRLAITNHHLLADGWSLPLILADLLQLYATAGARAFTPGRSYRTFLEWLARQNVPESLDVWTRALDGLEEPTLLASVAPEGSLPVPEELTVDLGAEIESGIVALARELGVTANTLVQAAWGVLLARTSGRTDVVFGATVSGRPPALAGIEAMVGLFINTLPVRVRFDENESIAALVRRLQGEQADLLDHHLVGLTDIQRATGMGTLFDTLTVFESYPVDRSALSEALDLGGLNVLDVDVHDASHYPLTLIALQDPALRFKVKFLPSVFAADEVGVLMTRLTRILAAFAARPDEPVGSIGLLDPAELRRLAPARGLPAVIAESGVEFFDRGLRIRPEGTAVSASGRSCTYRELDERSTRLARVLISRGAGPESFVALGMTRSMESVVGVWAVLKTGGAFVPVDPNYPGERIDHMLTDSGATIGLTVESERHLLPDNGIEWIAVDGEEFGEALARQSTAAITDAERVHPTRVDNPAYMIFTSGSTGTPKGVVVTRSGLTNFAAEQRERYEVTPDSRVLHVSSPSFDASVLEYTMAFGSGATLVVSPATVFGGTDLHDLIAAERVTHAFVTPSALASVDPRGLDCLQHLVAGGEAVPADIVNRWAPGRSLHNGYGPTETTIMVAISDPMEPGRTITIGGPVRGTQLLVLDDRLRVVPPGATGELYIAGVGLARGYHARAALTAQRFVASPVDPAVRMYRTGDLVRWRKHHTTGALTIEYLGRSDFQVKIRGLRIELGEIDATLGAHEAVDFVATLGVDNDQGQTQLVAYVLPKAGMAVDPAELTELAGRTLPAYMVPSSVMVLDEVPLTPVGKLDRRALPRPEFGFESTEYVAPVTPTEELVANIYADVLGVDRVGANDDFFALGGDSLVATRVTARVNSELSASIGVRDLFEEPTVGGLALRAEQSASGATDRAPLVAEDRPARIPLSLAQQRMWFLNRFLPDSGAYNVPMAIRLTGDLDVPAMREAFRDVLARHESLRTVFPQSADGPEQLVRPMPDVAVELPTMAVTEDELSSAALQFGASGFDVTREIPVRAQLFEIVSDTGEISSGPGAGRHHVLALVMHHIATDGWSLAPLARDLVLAYTARVESVPPAWAPLPVQYADFAIWQRGVLGDEADPGSLAARQIEFWTKELDGISDLLALPTDRPRPPVASGAGGRVDFSVDAGTRLAVEGLAHRHRSTPFMVLHGALAVLLARLTGESDIAVGTPVAGRGDAALDDLVGMFVNTLVLRAEIDPDSSFTDVLAEVRQRDLAAFEHADIPFERLVEVLNPVRTTAHTPLYQVQFALENFSDPTLELPGLTVAAEGIRTQIAKFDLGVTVTENADSGYGVTFAYATDLFDEATVERFAHWYLRLLDHMVDAPATAVGDLPLLTDAEASSAAARGSDHYVPVDARLLLDDFHDQAARTPDAVAVSDDESSLTYREFEDRVTRVARDLIALGVGPESTVALAVGRSVQSLVAAYAVVEAGGAYVPLDSEQPAERNAHVLAAAAPVCVVIGGTEESELPLDGYSVVRVDELGLAASGRPVTDADRRGAVRPENPAYVYFTSGSTGRPKGVVVSHRAIAAQLRWIGDAAGMTEADVVLHKSAPTFDVSVWEMFGGLQRGGRVAIARPGGHRDIDYLAALIGRERVTAAHFVPSVLEVMLGTGTDTGFAGSLRYLRVGGEAISYSLATRAAEAGLRVRNGYGPTESAVTVTLADEFDPATLTEGAVVPMGAPGRSVRARVLDGRLHPVPVGVAGELYLSGDQLARGYLGRPDLTADRFVADPFVPGARMYRTGDLVRWTASDELEFIGRTDFQVKVRGQRIELGEIEAALLAQPDVTQAVVVVHHDRHTGDQLVAYVVGAGVDSEELRVGLGRVLPSYMVPVAFVVLDAMPLGATGKLDRKALPEPRIEVDVEAFVAARGPIEEIISGIFSEVVGVPRVGATDNFFDLGGNSLVATRVIARVNEALGADLAVRQIFDAPTVAELAHRAETTVGRGRVPLAPQPRTDRVPLSLAQQRMWFLNRFDQQSAAYNMPFAIRLSGDLDIEALRAAMRDVLHRHESLRTVYPDSADGPFQKILPVDAVGVHAEPSVVEVAESDLEAAVLELATQPFDVTATPPLRARLLATAADEHVLVFVLHHIAFDGWSSSPLGRDLMIAYTARSAGDAPDWAPLAVQYGDFAIWQREVLGDEQDPTSPAARQLAYWRGALADLPDVLELPTDRPRPAEQSYRGGEVAFGLDAQTHAALLDVARSTNSTLFMVVHAALSVLLSRLSGSEDIAVGTPVAGRGDARLDDVVGMFVNTLVLRAEVGGEQSFIDLLAQVREHDLEAFTHTDLPFERLVEVLNPTRSASYHPLFQVSLWFQNTRRAALELPGLTVSPIEYETGLARFDLQITVIDNVDAQGAPGDIGLVLTYADDLFERATAEAFAARFTGLLETVAERPDIAVGDIELTSAAERDLLLDTWNDTIHVVPEVAAGEDTLVALFDAQVGRTPDAPALVFEGEQLTYREFDARANRLARHLIMLGVGPESVVGLSIRRSVDLLVGMYAIVKAGGAYVPLDPDHPAERNGYVLDSASPVCVLTTSRDASGLPDSTPVVVLDETDTSALDSAPVTDADRVSPLRPEHPANLIYTSGSTGRPKGIAVPHAGLVNQLRWMQAEYELTTADAVMLKTPMTFDVSVWEFFWTLQTGARLVIARPDGHRDPEYLSQLMVDENVTVVQFVPSMLAMFVTNSSARIPDSVRAVIAIGEALPIETAERFRALSSAPLDNLYGPAEASLAVTYWRHTPADQGVVPIGLPMWNTRVYVLDSRLRPVPVGVAGELYLSGVQLARGYYGRFDLSSDRFVADPFGPEGARMYRTGDLVRHRPQGDGGDDLAGVGRSAGVLEYIGRTDFQVKVRGNRIELGDIEAALLSAEGVSQSVVVVRTDPHTGDQLVGYVVRTEGAEVTAAAVTAHIAQSLPSYMVPASVVVLDEFPLNGSGKLDRKALPEPVFEVSVVDFVAPRDPVEEVVAGIFADVIGVPRISVEESFFDAGGNSLVATRLVSRVSEALGTRVAVRDLFEAPTVAQLAARVELSGDGSRPPLVPQDRGNAVPLSLAQQRMWFLNRFDPSSPAYNLPLAVRFVGPLDVDALNAAVADTIERHESLRTMFPDSDDGPHQVIVPASRVAPDLTAAPVATAGMERFVADTVTRGFDVTAEVPLHARLARVTDGDEQGEHVLVLVLHHISGDGLSMGPLARDVMIAYGARSAGEMPGWSPLAVQYADYSIWQRAVLGEASDPESAAARQIQYWRRTLAGLPDRIELPTDRPRPAVQSGRGADHRFDFGAELYAEVNDYARRNGVTPFMVLHAAFAGMLSQLAATEDIAIGTPIGGRGERALDDLIGMFVNTLVLRTRVSRGQSFDDLVEEVRAIDLAAYEHAEIPFEQLVDVLDASRSTSHSPLFQVALAFQAASDTRFELAGLEIEALDLPTSTAKYDLGLTVVEDAENGAQGVFNYATDLFDESTVAVFAERLRRLLAEALAEPARAVGELSVLDDDERTELSGVRGLPADPPRTLAGIFSASAAEFAELTAIEWAGEKIVYAELAERANQLGRELIEFGVGPDDIVAIALPRSADAMISIWAIAMAGGAYLPIDPKLPADRIAHMVRDSGAKVGLTSSELAAELRSAATPVHGWLELDDPEVAARIDRRSVRVITNSHRTAPLTPDHLAYMIYTSGTTGLPKGVAMSHAGLASLTSDLRHYYSTSTRARMLQFAAISFDAAVGEILATFGAGATMVIAPTDLYGGRELADFIAEQRITVFVGTPTGVQTVDATGLDQVERVVVGGDVCPPELAARWTGRLRNAYGPTETMVIVTITDPLAPGAAITIGSPMKGVHALILDAALRPVPVGTPGELYITNAGLARGYHQRHALTAERFVANPYGAPGERMYRTGDVVRWASPTRDGIEADAVAAEIVYVGRSDFQLQVRGFRVELGEIDNALNSHPSVAYAVTVGTAGPAGDTALVAYVQPVAGQSVDTADLAGFVSRTLPSYMVPTSIMVLDEVPLTALGKVDRAALPEPEFVGAAVHVPPVGDVQRGVAEIIGDVLAVERVGATDDFFDLGGNSLAATRVIARINQMFGASLGVRDIFDARSVAELADLVEHGASDARPRLSPRARDSEVPLSLAQQRMWFLNRLDQSSAAYNIPLAVRLSGDLDVDAFRSALRDVVDRHEVLRTVYPETVDGGRQHVLDVDDSGVELLAETVAAEAVFARVTELAVAGFDVAESVPVRAALLTIEGQGDEHVFVLIMHHIASDGGSLRPLVADLVTAYSARADHHAPDWAPLAVQYADYAIWQREVLGEPADPQSRAAAQLRYWVAALANLPDQLDLPTDRPRPARASMSGGRIDFRIDAEIHRGVAEIARAQGATVFMVMHAALATLLSRLSNTSDIAIGTAIAGRGEPEIDPLVGMFVNTLVLRTEVEPETDFATLLEHTRTVDLGAFAHTELPFERLVDELSPTRTESHHPLFQVAIDFQNATDLRLELPGLTVTPESVEAEIAKFDLQLTLGERVDDDGRPDGMLASFGYATDLFDAATVQTFADRLVRILSTVVVDPTVPVGDIPILHPVEEYELSNASGPESLPPRTLAQIFADAVAVNPGQTAVEAGDDRITYRELDARSNQLARVLFDRGVRAGSFVAIAMPRSIDTIVAVWAIAKTGAAFLPVDPNYPSDRIEHMLTDSAVTVGITTTTHRPALSDQVNWLALDGATEMLASVADSRMHGTRRVTPDDAAYVIYTSGSTGVPKGVVVNHRGLADLVAEQQAHMLIEPSSRTLQFASPSFDASVFEMMMAFGSAATLVVAPPDLLGGLELSDFMRVRDVTHACVTPAALAAADPADVGLSVLAVAGDVCPPELVARWAPGRVMLNLYGPTESTVWATVSAPLTPSGPITIGAPIRGFQVAVLDGRLRPSPVGVTGELYLSGPALARGYHARGPLTAERFIASPFGVPGQRMYRTGDVVRWRSDGNLEYVGRSDFQVKVRGFRIELGEVSGTLACHDSVGFVTTEGVVAPDGGTVLVAYVLPAAGRSVDEGALRAFAAEFLPAYMVPSHVIALDEVPRTPAGKLDRRALPMPEFVTEPGEYVAPRTLTEEIVAGVFAEVLGVDRVGVTTSFFDLGGNSLSATKVTARVGAALGVRVGVRDLFDAPSVAELAARMENSATLQARPLAAGPRPEQLPLSLAQRRMWFLNQFDTTSAAYNIPMAVRLSGDLDTNALEHAVVDVLERHEILRTVYPESAGGPVQKILQVSDVPVSLAPVRVREDEVVERTIEIVAAGFDVAAAPPVRVALLEVSPTERVFVVVMHHIASDGASVAPLARDIMVAYASRTQGNAPQWSPLPVQYADYALWQREVLGSPDDPESLISAQGSYWLNQLAGLPEVLDLPTDRPRPAIQSTAGAKVEFVIDADRHARLLDLARARGGSLFMVLHAAFAVLLSKIARESDIAIGTPVAGRGEQSLDDLVGMFVNTLVLRTVVESDSSFADLLDAARETDLSAFTHADMPFEQLVEALAPARSTAYSPLFQVMFTMQNNPSVDLELPGLTVSGLTSDFDVARFDLQLTVVDSHTDAGTPGDLVSSLTYAADLFDQQTVRALGEAYVRVLDAVVADPARPVGDVEIADAADLGAIAQVNETSQAVVGSTLVELFEQQVLRT